MATEIRVPAIATAGARLSIGRWFKRAGDAVSSDEPIVEIEADNVTLEIRSPISGVLTSVYVKDGASVEIGAVLGAISQFLNRRARISKAKDNRRGRRISHE